jgi:phosphatidylethanolamine-binding protein (PEBP) family uncharacterized protein
MSEFAFESSAFEHAQPIPSRRTCEGEDVAPPLRWTSVLGRDAVALADRRRSRCPERRLSLSDLDAEPEVAPGAAKAELEQVIDGHVPATAERVRTYER